MNAMSNHESVNSLIMHFLIPCREQMKSISQSFLCASFTWLSLWCLRFTSHFPQNFAFPQAPSVSYFSSRIGQWQPEQAFIPLANYSVDIAYSALIRWRGVSIFRCLAMMHGLTYKISFVARKIPSLLKCLDLTFHSSQQHIARWFCCKQHQTEVPRPRSYVISPSFPQEVSEVILSYVK